MTTPPIDVVEPFAPPPEDGHRFVVQRHRASHLHYDLRLEAVGVLLSWAVPKGPTLDPDVKRLAVRVEDHELGYYDFEGLHGDETQDPDRRRDVIVWDWGTWRLEPDAGRPGHGAGLDSGADLLDAVAVGNLHVDLHGRKLAGRFVLLRRGRQGPKEQWLLLHKHDEHAVPGWQPEDHLRSVKSGLTNDELHLGPQRP